VIKELFEFWVSEPKELPESYVEDVKAEGLARVVADYIAGMTDNFILLQYAEVRRRVRLGRVPFPEHR
jgi:dGTPase